MSQSASTETLQEVFLALLNAGLWQAAPDESRFPLTEEQWNEIFFVSVKQTVEGIVYDGICRLSPSNQPPEQLMIGWGQRVAQMEATYHQHLLVLNYLLARFEAAGIQPILQKGLYIASCYPVPQHRVLGDIDLFFRTPEESRKADETVEQWGMHVTGNNGENAYSLNGVVVEHHPRLFESHDLFRRKKLAAWMAEQTQAEGATRQLLVAQTPVCVLSPTLDLLLYATHSLKHLLNEGIGFRQLCDWAMYLNANREIIDGTALKSVFSMFAMEGWANLTCTFATKHLNLPAEKLPYPFEAEKYPPRRLLDEVWMSGNFGQMDERNQQRPSDTMGGKAFTAKRMFRNSFIFFRYAPGEAFWKPLELVGRRLIGK